MRSGWRRGSIYWVLLFWDRFAVTKPLSQIQRSTLWPLQDADPTPSFGGFGLRERIHIRADETWPTRGDERYRGSVTVTTKDGRQLNKESLWRRMSEEEVNAKFIYLAGLRIGEDKARELGEVLKQLDSVDNISDVLSQLEIPEARLEDL